jgi:hypothetical protein
VGLSWPRLNLHQNRKADPVLPAARYGARRDRTAKSAAAEPSLIDAADFSVTPSRCPQLNGRSDRLPPSRFPKHARDIGARLISASQPFLGRRPHRPRPRHGPRSRPVNAHCAIEILPASGATVPGGGLWDCLVRRSATRRRQALAAGMRSSPAGGLPRQETDRPARPRAHSATVCVGDDPALADKGQARPAFPPDRAWHLPP